MTSAQDIFQQYIPHPYRRPLARVVFVPFIVVALIVTAFVDAAKWCGEMAGEVISAWKSIRDW